MYYTNFIYLSLDPEQRNSNNCFSIINQVVHFVLIDDFIMLFNFCLFYFFLKWPKVLGRKY